MRMPKALAISAATAAILAVAPTAQAEPKHFTIDEAHTNVVFLVNHLGYSNMIGQFQDISGSFTFDKAAPENSEIELTIQADSVDTDHDKRDEHLRGPDFLNTAEYPTIELESTEIEVTGENTARLTGDLTMHGQTNPIMLDVTFNKMAPHPLPAYDGVLVAGFSARGTIQRSKWGIDSFVPNIGDEVKLLIEIEGHETDGN